jgi:hypothetical protein
MPSQPLLCNQPRAAGRRVGRARCRKGGLRRRLHVECVEGGSRAPRPSLVHQAAVGGACVCLDEGAAVRRCGRWCLARGACIRGGSLWAWTRAAGCWQAVQEATGAPAACWAGEGGFEAGPEAQAGQEPAGGRSGGSGGASGCGPGWRARPLLQPRRGGHEAVHALPHTHYNHDQVARLKSCARSLSTISNHSQHAQRCMPWCGSLDAAITRAVPPFGQLLPLRCPATSCSVTWSP